MCKRMPKVRAHKGYVLYGGWAARKETLTSSSFTHFVWLCGSASGPRLGGPPKQYHHLRKQTAA